MSDPERITQLFGAPKPVGEDDLTRDFVAIGRAIAAICATRILLLIAVLTGAAIWSFTVYDPTRERIAAAVAFSIVFVIPQVALFWRRG